MTSGGYAAPRSLDEAVSLLAKNSDARILAGGHGLLVEPSRSRIAGSLLVDLRKIPGLAGIEREPSGGVKIGAMTTLSAIAADEVIRQAYPALAYAAQMTGDAQLRNRATIGGSIATVDPEADLPALALMLNATIHAVGPKGSRTLGADQWFAAGQSSGLGSGEVITAVELPAPDGRSGTAYQSQRNPATLSPLCGVAASVTLGADGAVAACRVVLSGASERPTRLHAVEKMLASTKPSETAVAAAAAAASEGAAMRGDLFASAEYRAHLARVLTGRALKLALERAGR
jgi:carbon-monoxide dehydrogenase medium subunit